MKHLLMVLLFLVPAIANGGEATYSKSFFISADIPTLVNFLQQHESDVARATKCQFISRQGDYIRLRRDTARGSFEFTLRETITGDYDNAEYRLDFVESHVGTLTDEQTHVKLARVIDKYTGKSGTLMTITCRSVVSNLGNFQVRVGLSASGRGFERYVTGAF